MLLVENAGSNPGRVLLHRRKNDVYSTEPGRPTPSANETMPKSNKTKDHKRPRARLWPPRAASAPRSSRTREHPEPRRVWPSLVAPILDHLLIEHVMYYTCVAKLFARRRALPLGSSSSARSRSTRPTATRPARALAARRLAAPEPRAPGDARDRAAARGAPAPRRPGDGVAEVISRGAYCHRPLTSLQLPELTSTGRKASWRGPSAAWRDSFQSTPWARCRSLESLTVHCRGEANDWTTKLGRARRRT